MNLTSLVPMCTDYEQQMLPLYDAAPWFQPESERAILSRFTELLTTQSEVLARTAWAGHLTASALLVDAAQECVALTHHGKLGMWLQFGGHVDAEDDSLLEAAKRETREESGCSDCNILSVPYGTLPLDLDIHALPPLGKEPAHFHFDVRFLLYTSQSDLMVSSESNEVRWFSFSEAFELVQEPSLRRLLQKTLWLKGRVV